MQVCKIQDNTTFGINVAAHFSKTVQNHYNYNQVPNKLKRMYEFNQKVEQFSKFGHDNYTLDYEQKFVQGSRKHYLVATRNDGRHKINIIKQNTLAKVINNFLNMSEEEFSAKFPI